MYRNKLILASKIISVLFLIMVIFTPILSLDIELEWDDGKPANAEADYSTTMLNVEIFDMRYRNVNYNPDTGEFDISRSSSITLLLTMAAIILTVIILMTIIFMFLNFAVPAFSESSKIKIISIILNSFLLILSLLILFSKRIIATVSSLEIDRRGDLIFNGRIDGFDLTTTITFEYLFGYYMLLFGSLIGLISLFFKLEEYEYEEDDYEYDYEYDEEEEILGFFPGIIQKIKGLFGASVEDYEVKPRKIEQTETSNDKKIDKPVINVRERQSVVSDNELSQIVTEAKLERLALIDAIAEAKKITGLVSIDEKDVKINQEKVEEISILEEKLDKLTTDLNNSNDQYVAVKEEIADIQSKILVQREELETIEKQKKTTLDLIVQSEIELTKLKVEKEKLTNEINNLEKIKSGKSDTNKSSKSDDEKSGKSDSD